MPPTSKRPDRKRQTRLTLTPLPSSPTAPVSRSSPIGSNRLANVRVDAPFLTPQTRKPKAQSRIEDSLIYEERPTKRRRGESGDDVKDERDVRKSSVSSPALNNPGPRPSLNMPSIFRRGQQRRRVLDSSDEDEDEDEDEDDDDESSTVHPLQSDRYEMSSQVQKRQFASSPPKSQSRSQYVTINDSSSDDELAKPRSSTAIQVDSDSHADSKDDSEPIFTPRSRKKKDRLSSSTPKFRNPDDVLAIRKSPSGTVGADDDDSEPVITPAGRNLRKRTSSSQTPKTKHGDITLSSSEEDNGADDDEDSDSDVILTGRRRSAVKKNSRGSSPRPVNASHDLDIEEDLEDIDTTDIRKTRLRSNPQKGKETFRQRLDEIKRRREEKAARDRGRHPSSEAPQVIDSDSERGTEDEEVDEDDEIDQAEETYYRPEDEFDDDFVIEDEDDPLGVPVEELPFEFSHHVQKSNSELFKHVIEWMVHNKLNPSFDRDHSIFKRAFDKIGDEVQGQSSSKYKSSVWTRDFLLSLESRPEIEIRELHTDEKLYHNLCGACNRSNHPASYELRFMGAIYDPKTFEPLHGDTSSEEEEENEDGTERDAKGRLVPEAGRSFFVGRFCYNNATTAHILEHWRYRINDWLMDYLNGKGLFTNDEVLKRSKWKQKKLQKFADELVETLEEQGEIKRLWNDFRSERKLARENHLIEPVRY